MKKIVIINLAILVLFFVPTILFRFSHFKCESGNIGGDHNLWVAKADTFKKASSLAISMCKKGSDRPEKCDVFNCKNYFF